MSRSELTKDVLRPLVEKKLKAKEIAHRLGVSEITVKRALKRTKLRKSDVAAASAARYEILTPYQQSADPILKLDLSVAQGSAALALRNVMQDNSGLRGQNVLQMMMAHGSGFGPKDVNYDAIASDRKRRLKEWIVACRVKEIDYRPALEIAGFATSVRQVGAALGIGFKRARRICMQGLDLYATMQGWQRHEGRPRRRPDGSGTAWRGSTEDASDYAEIPEKYQLRPIGERKAHN